MNGANVGDFQTTKRNKTAKIFRVKLVPSAEILTLVTSAPEKKITISRKLEFGITSSTAKLPWIEEI